MRRLHNLCCWSLAMVLTLNLIWEPVFAKNKGEGGMLSEYYKKKQYKKMMKAAVPLMTFIGSMGWRAHQQHHPHPSELPPPPPPPPAPKTVIIHVPKPVPVPVPVPVYHYNIERHHHHKQKPKYVYLKNKKRKSRKKVLPLTYYSLHSEPPVVLSIPPGSDPTFFLDEDWRNDDLQTTFSSPITVLNTGRPFGEGGELFLGNEAPFDAPDLIQPPTGQKPSRRVGRVFRDDHHYETDN